jgi:spermidine synthase
VARRATKPRGEVREQPRPVPAASQGVAYPLVLLCFLLSGFAALLYETVWTRQFALVFGTSELAIATVLAAYMGGLAVGAAIAGRVAGQIRRPVLVYGLLELGIALAALAVPHAIALSTALARALFGGQPNPPDAAGLPLALFYLACSFLILLVPTALMGATLPLLARFAVRSDGEVGPRTATLYAVNTVGAVLGTVSAAFVLMPWLGLSGTVLVGAAANAAVFTAAVILARDGTIAAAPAVRADAGRAVSIRDRRGIVLPLILLSGATSFTYELLWSRLLQHVLGSSTLAFATMLASFLAGIAIGSAVAVRLAARADRALLRFGVAEVGIAVLSLGVFLALDRLPDLATSMGQSAAPGRIGSAAMAVLVMLPAALCIGATFPLAVRALARGGDEAATAAARAYAWNTAGAIVGAIGSGFFLIPLLGYVGIVTAAVVVNLLLALASGLASEPRSRRLAATAAVALLVLVVWRPPMPWRLVTTSPLTMRPADTPPTLFRVGRSSTVGVTMGPGIWMVTTNGLPEGQILPAGVYRRSMLERWLGALPCLARPDARSMLVIGFGAGTALEAVSRTLERIDVIELEPEVLAVNRLMQRGRAVDPLSDPRVHVHLNDARGALVLTERRYDLIVSQPSHPWTAGASHLYTREFFALVRGRLAPGGAFVQWIELNYVDEPLFRSLVATLLDVFPNVRVYRPVYRSGVLFVASDAPLPIEETAARAIAASRDTFGSAGVQAPEDVAAAIALDEEGSRRFAAGYPPSTDDRNLFQSSATILSPLWYQGGDALLSPLDPLPRLAASLDRVYLVRRLVSDFDLARVRRLAITYTDPAEQQASAGILALASDQLPEAERLLRTALDQKADNYAARMTLVRFYRDRLLGGDAEVAALAAALPEPAATVVEGWRLEARRDWDALRQLEPRFTGIAVQDPAYPDAQRLRARWRLETGDRALLEEGVSVIDLRLLPMSLSPDDVILRARFSAKLGNAAAALSALSHATEWTTRSAGARTAARVREVLPLIPPAPEVARFRSILERRVGYQQAQAP